MCGFKYLINILVDLIREILGVHVNTIGQAVFPNASRTSAADTVVEVLRTSVENACRVFKGDEEDTTYITFKGPRPLPEIRGLSMRGNSLGLKTSIIKEKLNEYKSKLVSPLHDQISEIEDSGWANDSGIENVVAGGGSLCPYLADTLRTEFEGRYPITFDEKCEYSMIARGAFNIALDPDLGKGHFAAAYVGVPLTHAYDESLGHKRKDRIKAKEWSPSKWEVRNCYFPGIKKVPASTSLTPYQQLLASSA